MGVGMWMWVPLILLPLVSCCSWGLWEWIWRPWRLLRACREQGMRGLPFVPFVGQLLRISQVLRGVEKGWSGVEWASLSSARECLQEYGKVFYFTTGRTVRIVVADPDLVKVVLATNADSFAKPSFIHVLGILGAGIFSSSGDVWAPQRQLLALSFTNKEIKTELDVIANSTRSALKSWLLEIKSGCAELLMYERLLELTVNAITKLAFGAETVGDGRTSSDVARSFNRYLLNCRELVFGPAAAIPGYRFLPTQMNRDISKDTVWLCSVIEELIKGRSAEHPSSPSHHKRNHRNVLDMLVDAANGNDSPKMTNQQLRDNCMTFLLAGHHSTASLLTWAMYLLALHPLWQERARAEVDEFCRGAEVEWSTLSRLKTITMIIHETLRLFPPVPLIGRRCLKPNSMGPYIIPEGVEILIPTALIHRDKDLWGDHADEFQPMRFADGIGKACKNILGYLPFGSGPRTCIGQNLAIAETRTVLAIMLSEFIWRVGPTYEHCPDVSMTLYPKFDIPFIMESRLLL